MQAVTFERTSQDGHPLEINLATDHRFDSDYPNPAVAVTVTNWSGGALSGITVPTPTLGGANNRILQFIPTGGTNGTTYYLRFMVTTLLGYPCEIDVILYVRQPPTT